MSQNDGSDTDWRYERVLANCARMASCDALTDQLQDYGVLSIHQSVSAYRIDGNNLVIDYIDLSEPYGGPGIGWPTHRLILGVVCYLSQGGSC